MSDSINKQIEEFDGDDDLPLVSDRHHINF